MSAGQPVLNLRERCQECRLPRSQHDDWVLCGEWSDKCEQCGKSRTDHEAAALCNEVHLVAAS